MDLYSFGVIVWQLYHGKVPFDGNLVLCTDCILKDTRPQISEMRDLDDEEREEEYSSYSIVGMCSAPIANLIRGCWASEPTARLEFN